MQHNTVHPACETVPNKHQMAFLFLDGEAWQRCLGTVEKEEEEVGVGVGRALGVGVGVEVHR